MPNYEKPPIANNKENATDKLLPKQPHVKTLWMLRAFDRHGDEDNRGDNSDAMAFASQLEAALKTGPSSSVILIRDDLDDNSRSTGTTPTVVAFRPDATANEVRAILHRAIDITLGKYPSQDPKTPQVTDEELAEKARRNLIQTWTLPATTKDAPAMSRAQQVGSELAVGTIRGSKIKSGTKALEKIIARQAQRIEELAMQVGKIENVAREHFQMLDDVLKAAGANGISQVLSILVAVKAGKPVPEVSEMPEFPSRSTTFYMTKP